MDTVSGLLHVFKSMDEQWLVKKGEKLLKVSAVLLDREYYPKDMQELQGEEVLLDGRLVVFKGFELFMHCEPWRQGERAGLVYEEVTDG